MSAELAVFICVIPQMRAVFICVIFPQMRAVVICVFSLNNQPTKRGGHSTWRSRRLAVGVARRRGGYIYYLLHDELRHKSNEPNAPRYTTPY